MQGKVKTSNSERHYNEFCHWVWKFSKEKKLFNPPKNLVLLCSGGADSLALFYVISEKLLNYSGKLNVVYFDHGTRSPDDHQKEITLIQSAISTAIKNDPRLQSQISFYSLKLPGLSLDQADFENRARQMRDQWIKEKFDPQEHYYLTGHHINDSFEWWLRGRLTQNHPHKPLGIPLINDSYRRPFNCVTKEQILKFMEVSNFSFAIDSSNGDLKFERNFLRQEVINSLKQRYPNYLRHYVNQRNQELAVYKSENIKRVSVLKINSDLLFFSLIPGESKLNDLEIVLRRFSLAKQGMLRKSLLHIFGTNPSLLDHSNGLKGPMSLSGHLHLWQWNHFYFLSISKIRPEKSLNSLDQLLCAWLLRHNQLATADMFRSGGDAHFSKNDKDIILLFNSLGLSLTLKNKNPRNSKQSQSEGKFLKVLCPKFYQAITAHNFLLIKA